MSKKKKLGELVTDNKENAAKLDAADIKVFSDKDKTEKKISKLILENKQNAEELSAAYKIIATHKKEIEKQAADLISAKKELAHKAELIILNKELTIQITERKQSEKALFESEEKYRLLFSENPQPMWIYDLETLAFLEINQAAIKHYGYSQQEFLSMTLKDIRPAEDIPALLKDIEQTSNNLNSAGEWRHLKKNGEVISVEITSHSVISNNPHARHVLINDITERKRSQLEYQTMIKTSRDGFWIVDAKTGKFLDVNQSYCDMIGYSRGELFQMTIQDVEAVETHEETKWHIELIIEKGFDSFETKHKTKSGKIIDLDTSVTLISSGGDKFFVFVKDITQRKQTESEIIKLSHAVEQSPISILITDTKGNIEYVNPIVAEITGYKLDELIGKNSRIFNSGEMSKSEYQILWDTISSGKEWFGEFHNKKKNGELYWESASISPIMNENGEITHYVSIKEDITEKKEKELELIKAKEKAEESDRLKTAFMNNISHEIRTPLNAILGFAPFVIEPNISQEEKEMFLNTLNVSGERLLNTVNDYMDISLIVSNSMEVHSKLVDISLLFSKLYESFKKPCILKNLELKLSLPNDGETYSIKTDEELLHKILSHLVDNAVKFTTKGYVELGFSLNKNLQSNEIEMFVKDSGQGIANDSQKLIFDVFMQENISNTRAHEGSGLGLSIAKGLTKLLGGNIRLESVENEGTTVFVTLPFVESVSSEKTETALHNNIKKKLQTILIAEDDDLNYLYFETTLKGRFSKILWAKNGQEAVDLCHKHPEIDLVLMDIKMPVMNGIEATQQIKSFRKDLPIIAVTAFALAGDEHRFLEAGCDDYISKPFAAKKLIELVSKYLKRPRD